MLFEHTKGLSKRHISASAEEKLSQVKRLEDGQMYWIKVFEKQQEWTVELSGMSSRLQDLKHSYIFPKGFGMDQVVVESERMYLDFLATQMN